MTNLHRLIQLYGITALSCEMMKESPDILHRIIRNREQTLEVLLDILKSFPGEERDLKIKSQFGFLAEDCQQSIDTLLKYCAEDKFMLSDYCEQDCLQAAHEFEQQQAIINKGLH